jgi:hypothetical protein
MCRRDENSLDEYSIRGATIDSTDKLLIVSHGDRCVFITFYTSFYDQNCGRTKTRGRQSHTRTRQLPKASKNNHINKTTTATKQRQQEGQNYSARLQKTTHHQTINNDNRDETGRRRMRSDTRPNVLHSMGNASSVATLNSKFA